MPGTDRPLAETQIIADMRKQLRQMRLGNGIGDPENVNRVTSAGAAQTIPDVTVATISYLTLTTACTLTFPTAVAGKSFTVVLEQDGSGGHGATWPGSVKWAGGGAAPVLTVAASKADVFTFLSYDGSNWAGFIAGQNI